MHLIDIMKENDIDTNWLFSLARFDNKEGLIFFEPLTAIDENTKEEYQAINPKCIMVDGAKFIYNESMDKEISIKSTNNTITLSRIDGIEIKLSSSDFTACPFTLEEFRNTKAIHTPNNVGYVKVDD